MPEYRGQTSPAVYRPPVTGRRGQYSPDTIDVDVSALQAQIVSRAKLRFVA